MKDTGRPSNALSLVWHGEALGVWVLHHRWSRKPSVATAALFPKEDVDGRERREAAA